MCQKIKEKRGEEPDCLACTPPLFPENEDAVRIYFLCQDQVRIAPMGGVIGLDHNAIHAAMELYGVSSPETFEKVLLLGREFNKRSK